MATTAQFNNHKLTSDSDAFVNNTQNFLGQNGITNTEWQKSLAQVRDNILAKPEATVSFEAIPNPFPGRVLDVEWARALKKAINAHPGNALAVLASARHNAWMEKLAEKKAEHEGHWDGGHTDAAKVGGTHHPGEDGSIHKVAATAATTVDHDHSDRSTEQMPHGGGGGSHVDMQIDRDLRAFGGMDRQHFHGVIKDAFKAFRGSPEMAKLAAAATVAGHDPGLIEAMKHDYQTDPKFREDIDKKLKEAKEAPAAQRDDKMRAALGTIYDKYHDRFDSKLHGTPEEKRQQFVEHGVRFHGHVEHEAAAHRELTAATTTRASYGAKDSAYFASVDTATSSTPTATVKPAVAASTVPKSPYASLGVGMHA